MHIARLVTLTGRGPAIGWDSANMTRSPLWIAPGAERTAQASIDGLMTMVTAGIACQVSVASGRVMPSVSQKRLGFAL